MLSEVAYPRQILRCGDLRVVATLEFLEHHPA